MKNIHVIPTDKPSRLVLDTVNNNLFLTTTKNFPTDIMKFQNIYITNDEEIKIGDWFIFKDDNTYLFQSIGNTDSTHIKVKSNNEYGYGDWNKDYCKKIILTTDQSLDGVQAIDDELLEWFIKNPSCENVDIDAHVQSTENGHILYYQIIIPKEEPKREFVNNASKWNMEDFEEPKPFKDMLPLTQVDLVEFKKNPVPTKKETLEEVLKKIKSVKLCLMAHPNNEVDSEFADRITDLEEIQNELSKAKWQQETLEEAAERIVNSTRLKNPKSLFCEGAKWQQEQIIDFLHSEITERRDYSASKMCEKVIEFIKQFKNK